VRGAERLGRERRAGGKQEAKPAEEGKEGVEVSLSRPKRAAAVAGGQDRNW